MRVHILGVPHTVSNDEYVACAYTAKIVKFCKMMHEHIDIFHYGHEDSVIDCREHITVTTNQDMVDSYGDYDWKKGFFKFSLGDKIYKEFADNAFEAISERFEEYDIILPFFGAGVKEVCDRVQSTFATAIVIEPGIGYGNGSWAKYRVYESYAIMHGVQGPMAITNCHPEWYHTVIPNYFDVSDFEYNRDKDDYYLFIGRIYDGKGPQIAIEVCRILGKKLIMAGQKDDAFVIPDGVEHIGYADKETRKVLMANAKAAFVPSLYNEPFGGVMVENLLSGTPLITTDWGAMAEINDHGITGYRCRTLGDFIDAVIHIEQGSICPVACRRKGLDYDFNNVRPQYLKFFNDVLDVHTGDGWYEIKDRKGKLL